MYSIENVLKTENVSRNIFYCNASWALKQYIQIYPILKGFQWETKKRIVSMKSLKVGKEGQKTGEERMRDK